MKTFLTVLKLECALKYVLYNNDYILNIVILRTCRMILCLLDIIKGAFPEIGLKLPCN